MYYLLYLKFIICKIIISYIILTTTKKNVKFKALYIYLYLYLHSVIKNYKREDSIEWNSRLQFCEGREFRCTWNIPYIKL